MAYAAHKSEGGTARGIGIMKKKHPPTAPVGVPVAMAGGQFYSSFGRSFSGGLDN